MFRCSSQKLEIPAEMILLKDAIIAGLKNPSLAMKLMDMNLETVLFLKRPCFG
jgi:hypothetical protein